MIPIWLEMAIQECGESEVVGPRSNQRILDYHSETTLKATSDEIPWCSAFVCAMMEWSNISSPKSARARDWLHWGKFTMKPVLGCVVVLSRDGDKGHVGFYFYETDTTVAILGGNQNNMVNVTEFPKSRILGFRMPKDEDYKDVPPNNTASRDLKYS